MKQFQSLAGRSLSRAHQIIIIMCSKSQIKLKLRILPSQFEHILFMYANTKKLYLYATGHEIFMKWLWVNNMPWRVGKD